MMQYIICKICYSYPVIEYKQLIQSFASDPDAVTKWNESFQLSQSQWHTQLVAFPLLHAEKPTNVISSIVLFFEFLA